MVETADGHGDYPSTQLGLTAVGKDAIQNLPDDGCWIRNWTHDSRFQRNVSDFPLILISDIVSVKFYFISE